MKQLFLLLFGLALFVLPYCQAQPLTSEEHPVTLNTASGSINGKLLLPAHAKSCQDRKSTRLNSSHASKSRMPSSA